MASRRGLLRSGTKKKFAPMADVNMVWSKPSKLLNISQVKVGRIMVFGFGHLGDNVSSVSIGRRVLSELPKRYPTLYPPFREAVVGTWKCQVSHGPRITLLQSPVEVRAQHLGPWTLRTMRGVIQGFVDGKRKEIPGTLADIYPDSQEAIGAPLTPLDAAAHLREHMHDAVDAGADHGIQAGLLEPGRTAVVVIHQDPMRLPGKVDVPPWQPGHIESFNGVTTCFKKGFLSGVRGAHIAIGIGWPGFEKGEPVPHKPELIPKLWSSKKAYDEAIVDTAVYETQARLVKLQERWGLPVKKDVEKLWQPEVTEQQQSSMGEQSDQREARLMKIKEDAIQELDDVIKAVQDVTLETRQARKDIIGSRQRRLSQLKAEGLDPEELKRVVKEVTVASRAEWTEEKKRLQKKLGKQKKRELRITKLLRSVERSFESSATGTLSPDRILAIQKHRFSAEERRIRALAKDVRKNLEGKNIPSDLRFPEDFSDENSLYEADSVGEEDLDEEVLDEEDLDKEVLDEEDLDDEDLDEEDPPARDGRPLGRERARK